MTAQALKPCPFCGDLEPLVEGGGYDVEGGGYDVNVTCSGCFATGPTATIGCRDPDEEAINLEDEAVALWNQRALLLRLVEFTSTESVAE